MKQQCLMLGAGHTEPFRKLRAPTSAPDTFKATKWTRLDMNRDSYPDIRFNLNRIESWIPWWNRIPVKDETFDEIHAYQVMEHYGRQGDYKGFFRGMRELWRILKPGGYLVGSSPLHQGMWAWGDPGHTRVITEGTLLYLDQRMYSQLGKTPSSDYRKYVAPRWWDIEFLDTDGKKNGIHFCLKKVAE
jgi:SAM-dependent methyltransferase